MKLEVRLGAIITLLLLIIATVVDSPDSSEFKIKSIDKKLERIIEHLSMGEMSIDEELKELLSEEKKTSAIKKLERVSKKQKNILIICKEATPINFFVE